MSSTSPPSSKPNASIPNLPLRETSNPNNHPKCVPYISSLTPAEAESDYSSYDPESNSPTSKPRQILLLPERKQPGRTLMLVLALMLCAWHLYSLHSGGLSIARGRGQLDISAVLP